MSVLNQKTLKSTMTFEGIALHSGKMVHMKVRPAHPNTGIVFKRTDLKNNNIVIPGIFNVSSAIFCTTISNDYGVNISTIEHLMGAFYGLGVDNAIVEINSQEVPILDGSAKNFVELIKESGFRYSDAPLKIIKVNKKIELNEKNKKISIDVSNVNLDIEYEIKYDNSLIKNQRNNIGRNITSLIFILSFIKIL